MTLTNSVLDRRGPDFWLALLIVVAFIALAVIITPGCKSTSGGIKADPYKAEVEAAIDRAMVRLSSVGAHVRRPDDLNVTFKAGTDRTYLGYGFRHGGGIVGGVTIGRHVMIATTPDGQFQPLIAELELCHSCLQGTEASDYAWIKRAYPEWRGI
jgi:hypothetical protein